MYLLQTVSQSSAPRKAMDPPEETHSSKRRNKWTLGNFFRRKKTTTKGGVESSDSSSELEEKPSRTFLGRRRSARKRSDINNKRSLSKDSSNNNLKNNIPWNGSANSLGSSDGFGSHSSLTRKDRREIMKARMEATRKQSSSEDESFTTGKSNSLIKYQSDESLSNKKTRAARTERYLKRFSRDEESNSHYSLSKSDVEIHHPPPPVPTQPQWTASVAYRETSPYVRAVSATPSPIVSPKMQHRIFTTYPPPSNTTHMSPHLPRRSYCEPPRSDILPMGYRSSSNINLACNTNGLPSPQVYYYPPIRSPYKQSSLPPPPPPPRDPQRKMLIYNGNNEPSAFVRARSDSGNNEPSAFVRSRIDNVKIEPPAFVRSRSDLSNTEPTFIRSRSDHILSKQMTPEPPIITSALQTQFQYLADKTPRSRRPIHVVPIVNQQHENSPECTMPVAPEWLNTPISEASKLNFIPEKRKLPEEKRASSVEVHLRSQSKTPPPPPIRRYSRQSSVSSLDDEPNKKQSSNLEEALNELEAIYQSLRLGDEDLLDRAERRDLPTAHQNIRLLNNNNDDDSVYNEHVILRRKNRAPPNRRSGIPDPVTDDMAYRRLHQPVQAPNKDRQSGSYLLISPTLSPVPVQHDPEEPDTTYDDMSYRAIRNANSVRVIESHPPFGIPLTPASAAPDSDYLHAKPIEKYRPTFRPRKTPDVVKDDLAFRNLRKDNTKLSNDKRKRAVRSLSANIINLMDQQDDIEKTQSLTSVPTSLQLLLENTEMNPEQVVYKRPPPSWIERANLMDTSTETLTESRANLRSLRNSYITDDSRPNSLFIPQRSKVTPIKEDISSPTSPSCPFDEEKLEELLSALAKEAHDTSERLGRELERLRDGSHSVENKSPNLITQGNKTTTNNNNNVCESVCQNNTNNKTNIEKITKLKSALKKSIVNENNVDEYKPVYNVVENETKQNIIQTLPRSIFFEPEINSENIASSSSSQNIDSTQIDINLNNSKILSISKENLLLKKSEDYNNNTSNITTNISYDNKESIKINVKGSENTPITFTTNTNIKVDGNDELNENYTITTTPENKDTCNKSTTTTTTTDIDIKTEETIKLYFITSESETKVNEINYLDKNNILQPLTINETINSKSDIDKNDSRKNQLIKNNDNNISLLECISIMQSDNGNIIVDKNDSTLDNNLTNTLDLYNLNYSSSSNDMFEYNQDLRRMSSEITQTLSTILEENLECSDVIDDTTTNNTFMHVEDTNLYVKNADTMMHVNNTKSVIPDIVFNIEDFSDLEITNNKELLLDEEEEEENQHNILDKESTTGGEILLADFGLANFQTKVQLNACTANSRYNANNITTSSTHNATLQSMDFDFLAFIGAVVALVSILTALSMAGR